MYGLMLWIVERILYLIFDFILDAESIFSERTANSDFLEGDSQIYHNIRNNY